MNAQYYTGWLLYMNEQWPDSGHCSNDFPENLLWFLIFSRIYIDFIISLKIIVLENQIEFLEFRISSIFWIF